MKKKLLIVPLMLLLGYQFSIAQNAKAILDKVSQTYTSPSGYVLSFTLNTEDIPANVTYSHDGKAYIKGNKFKIEVPDGVTWFDGKTQWVYMNGSDEVNVSSPTGEELAAISPVALLNIYKSGFKLEYKGNKTEKGKSVYVIDMIPQRKGGDITRFTVKIDKATNYFTEIILFGKNKENNCLIFNSHRKGTGLTDNFFVFNKKDYPEVEVIDLR